MRDTRYEGWANFATWGVALILNNNRDTYEEVTERYAKSAPADYDWIRDYVERLAREEDDHRADAATAMVRQMVSAGLAEVEWSEIHAGFLAAAAEA